MARGSWVGVVGVSPFGVRKPYASRLEGCALFRRKSLAPQTFLAWKSHDRMDACPTVGRPALDMIPISWP